jgi:hypothetical protein
MPEEIISAKTRKNFREHFVGTTLRLIRDAFDGGGVRCDLEHSPPGVDGQRRTLVEQYYKTVDWSNWHSVSRVVKVYENELRELYAPLKMTYGGGSHDEDSRKSSADELLYWLKQDGFE